MAIYHFHGQVISRSAGRSSVAAASYRSAELLVDERTGLTHDFTKKEHDVFYKEILTPEGAPEWMKDRKTLWNAVEKIEKRKDAQLAREFNIALPRELTDEQNVELARRFVQKNFVDKGMVADLCLHHGHNGLQGRSKVSEGDRGNAVKEDQPHIHVMVTLREVTPEGFGQKVREWNARELLNEWRKEWAQEANFFLAMNGRDLRIDHRTLAEQGIELEPQTKIGSKAAYSSYSKQVKYEEHQQIARENGERIYEDPTIALNALIHQQSTFTHQDLAKFVNRHTVDQEQFDRVYTRVKGCQEIVFLGQDDLKRERFTTREMLDLELQMVKRAIDKVNHAHFAVDNRNLTKALEIYPLYDEQKQAFYHITGKEDLACVVGYAGTGKSTMLGAAREAWQEEGYYVQGMTFSGKAAESLEISSGIRSHTIANRLINWENGRERLTNKDVVVVDEAAMVGSRDLARIMDEAYTAHAKVVLVGDPEQIQAILAGAAFRAITERVGYAEMVEVGRQKVEWQREATKQLATGQTAAALLAYEEKGHIHSFNTKAVAMEAMISEWDETRSNQPDKTSLMIAYTRTDVQSLNERAREIRQSYDELGEDHTVDASRGRREFAENDRIYFLKNDKELGVKNGTLGTIQSIEERENTFSTSSTSSTTRFTVKVDREGQAGKQEQEKARVVQFDLEDYNHIEHGYASTVHKAQGSTVDYSYVLASKYFDRHITYSAMSRHRENAEFYYSKDEFKDFRQLSGTLERENLKDVSLDYLSSSADSASSVSSANNARDYAQARGIELNDALEQIQERERDKVHAQEGTQELTESGTELQAASKELKEPKEPQERALEVQERQEEQDREKQKTREIQELPEHQKDRGHQEHQKNQKNQKSQEFRERDAVSDERLQAAEKRLAERQFKETIAPEIRQFERDTGRKVSLNLEDGEKGIYRGTVKFGEERYGILEKKDEIKLVPYENCHNLDRGREAKIERTTNDKGHELHQAVPVQERTRERELGLELER